MPLYLPASTRLGYGAAPEDHGLLAWTMDPQSAGTGTVLAAAGTLQGARLYLPRPMTVTNLCCHVSAAGATLTAGSCKAALYNSVGTLIGTTVDQATAWASTGFKAMALTAPVVCPAGYYDIALWYNGTTSPSIYRTSAVPVDNANLTGASARFFTANTTNTTTAPAPLGTKTVQNTAWWLAVS